MPMGQLTAPQDLPRGPPSCFVAPCPPVGLHGQERLAAHCGDFERPASHYPQRSRLQHRSSVLGNSVFWTRLKPLRVLDSVEASAKLRDGFLSQGDFRASSGEVA